MKRCGKTKLLQEIVNHYMDVNTAKIMYVIGHGMYQDLENAKLKKDIFVLTFKRQFRKSEVICIENVRELLSDEKLYRIIQEVPMLYERATMVVIPKV